MEITIGFFHIAIIIAIVLIAYFIKEGFFKTKDSDITNNILEKYPDVTQVFASKSLKEQNIENNQEIHDINKRFDKLERENELLKSTLNKNIETIDRMQTVIEELKNG